jgi:O-antigen ligase
VSEQPVQPQPAREVPTFVNWMGSLWGYTILRFGMFFALWGLLVLVGLGGLLAALIALVLSVPLALVLLSGPRNRVAQNIEARVEAARAARAELDARLDPNPHDD